MDIKIEDYILVSDSTCVTIFKKMKYNKGKNIGKEFEKTIWNKEN
jgi:hypothetical protein